MAWVSEVMTTDPHATKQPISDLEACMPCW